MREFLFYICIVSKFKIMIKKFIILLFLHIFIVIFSQNLTVKYELNYHPSSNKKDSIRSKLYFLDIVNNESIFRDAMRRQSDSLIFYGNGYGLGYPNNINDQLYLRKNLNDHSLLKYIVLPLSRDIFFVKINESLNWKLSAETKMIEKLKCQKAEVDYGGRTWTAWFTKEIPFQEGPYIFNGLPGLIVEMYDSSKDYFFKLASIIKSHHKDLFAMKGGRQVSWEDLIKIQLEYYNDPFSKVQNLKVMTDDGAGGLKKVNLREGSISIQNNIKEYNNVIELNKKIEYK